MGKTRFILYMKALSLGVALLAIGWLIASNTAVAWRIAVAVAGFTAVVFIHECGHFFVAKAVGIKVEVFSIFLPPVLIGIRRTGSGYRIRILPDLFGRPDGSEEGLLSFTIGRPGQPSDTEYRIGLVPIAGYVKMLGQDDLGPDKQVDDPRSFGNKPIWARMAVIAAGVTCNVIAAVLICSLVYLIGIRFPAPVVGQVLQGSPAAEAGLSPGDRIIQIAGQKGQLQPDDIMAAAVLSNPGQPVPMTIRRKDGSLLDLAVVAEQTGRSPFRHFGIEFDQQTLVVAKVDNPSLLYRITGLNEGDRVLAVNGRQVQEHWEFLKAIGDLFEPNVVLTVERSGPEGRQLVQVPLKTYPGLVADNERSEADLRHIYGLVPRMQVAEVQDGSSGIRQGDIILQVAGIENPTFLELRRQIESHEDRPLLLRLLRADPNGTERIVEVITTPRRSIASDRVLIGIAPSFDLDHPVVAKAIDLDNIPALPIPRGATITRMADRPVSSFYDVAKILLASEGQQVTVAWRALDGQEGSCLIDVRRPYDRIVARPQPAYQIPFAPLLELHKADTLVQALAMGTNRSMRFVIQTYVTVKQLLSGAVRLRAMSGPVGIATIAYRAVEHSFVTYLYMLAFISANLAVVNFLPLPVVDGGLFLLLIVEKIRGSPLSVRVQEVITYVGLVLIASLFVYLTYNDLIRIIFG